MTSNYIDIHIIIMSDVYVNMSQSWSFKFGKVRRTTRTFVYTNMGDVCKGTTGVVYTQVDSVDLPNV